MLRLPHFDNYLVLALNVVVPAGKRLRDSPRSGVAGVLCTEFRFVRIRLHYRIARSGHVWRDVSTSIEGRRGRRTAGTRTLRLETARVAEFQRVVVDVAVAVQALTPEGILGHGIRAQEPRELRVVEAAAHVDEPDLWVVLVAREPRQRAR